MSTSKKSFAAVAGLLLAGALVGCSSSETTTSASSTTGGSGSTGTQAGSGTTMAEMAACENALEITNAEAAEIDGLTDGEVTIETAWADEGKHPDNTVDYDNSLEFLLASFEVEVDPQFGYSIPVGTPEVPAEEFYLSVSLQNLDEAIDAGMSFTDSTGTSTGSTIEVDGEINFISAYVGADRLLMGDATVTITEFTDDYICGEITTVTDTDLQSFIGVEGTFELDRIQALEAAADEDGDTTSGTTAG